MNFNITAVFSPLERAELKRKFNQQKRLDAQLDKVGQQAARSYKSTVQVKRVSRRKIVAEEDDDADGSESTTSTPSAQPLAPGSIQSPSPGSPPPCLPTCPPCPPSSPR
jgi:hypothetical protein